MNKQEHELYVAIVGHTAELYKSSIYLIRKGARFFDMETCISEGMTVIQSYFFIARTFYQSVLDC